MTAWNRNWSRNRHYVTVRERNRLWPSVAILDTDIASVRAGGKRYDSVSEDLWVFAYVDKMVDE